MNLQDFIRATYKSTLALTVGSNRLDYDMNSPFAFMRANGLMPKPKMKLFGIDVYESPLCTRRVPVKQHKSKAALGRYPGVYSERIQKKWNKRYGFKIENVMYMVGDSTVMMHRDDIEDLMKETRHALRGLPVTGVILDDVL